MAPTRTQVYLTEDQRRMIDEIARAEGVTLADSRSFTHWLR